jgi:choline dehydrogenase
VFAASRKSRIQPNYLSHEKDVKVLVEGVKLGRKVAQTAAMTPFRGPEHMPGAKITKDEELVEFVKNAVETLYHPVGTCKMGTDALSVVDSSLAVKNFAGLRVVDASVMPIIPGGNTNAPTIMIAEKASDVILAKN